MSGTGTSSVLEAVRALAPEIASRADEIEQKREVPADLVEKLVAAGAFRMLLPREFGGEQLDLPEACRVLEEVGRADGSAGWTVMIGADFAIVWGRFSREVLDEVFAGGPDVLVRGAFAPKGMATTTDGGFTVSGQWPLGSGSYANQWVMGNCVVVENGAPKMTSEGIPEMRVALIPADQAEWLDTWHSMGLAGTKSDDFVIKEQFVPEKYTAHFFGGSVIDAPLYKLPLRVALGPTHSGLALGIARGALDDLTALAKTKRPAFNPMQRLAEDPVFQWRLGEVATRLDAARNYHEGVAQEMWEKTQSDVPVIATDNLRLRSMVSWVHREAMAVANEAFTLAGSNALYDTSSLQRRWRDIRAMSQHTGASLDVFQLRGAVLMGEDVPAFLTSN